MLLSFTRGLVVRSGSEGGAVGAIDRAPASLEHAHGRHRRLWPYGPKHAQKLNGFGARCSRTRAPQTETGVEFDSLDTLLRESDAVIVHIPLTSRNEASVRTGTICDDEAGHIRGDVIAAR